MGLSEDQPQPLAPQPGDDDSVRSKPAASNSGLCARFWNFTTTLRLLDRDICRGIDQVPEQVPALGGLIAIANAVASSR